MNCLPSFMRKGLCNFFGGSMSLRSSVSTLLSRRIPNVFSYIKAGKVLICIFFRLGSKDCAKLV